MPSRSPTSPTSPAYANSSDSFTSGVAPPPGPWVPRCGLLDRPDPDVLLCELRVLSQDLAFEFYIDLAGETFREEAERLERRLWGEPSSTKMQYNSTVSTGADGEAR
jgi:hypothetical protein